ncbi:MAG: chloride channel protein [Paludibacteraceae bacterium]|nr:chloride channel protein [Paludibacteraceae bacterium]
MILWRERNIKQDQFIIILSLLVGIFTALAAIILKNIIHLIKSFLVDNININGVNYLFLAFPAAGILLASLYVRLFVKDDISHGITKILYAISQRKARIKPHNMWSSIIASALTIGFGGSVGAEAPIVLTGSAIGSNLGRFFKMDQKVLMLMVGCGAAGAIGGIFNAPIAGVVFTLEVLMVDLTMSSIIPLLISSVTATAMSYFFMGSEAMFNFKTFEPFALSRIPYLLLLGIVCGFVSLYFTRGVNSMETFFGKMKSPYTKLAIGGVILSGLIFFLPSLYGEGYDTISVLLNDDPNKIMAGSLFYGYKNYEWVLFIYLGLTVVFKIVATSSTNGAGGTGGIFAPSLFVGCLTGYLVALLLHFMGINIPERNFAFAGMAGVMSAVMHAPLTGIFLIAELTGGYSLFMTLMITSTVAYLTIIIFEPHSLYAMRLAKKGELLTHHKDKVVLTLLKMDNLIETDLKQVHPDMNLGDLVKVISSSKRNIFPVVSRKGLYLGEVQLDEVRNIMFRQELYSRFTVRRLMISPPAIITVEESMDKVMNTFDKCKAWNLPVVDQEGKYLGYVSKSQIFNSYRQVLVHFSDD